VNTSFNYFIIIFCVLTGCNFNQEKLNASLNLQHGFELYTAHCSNCHQIDGSGLAKLIPPLNNSDWLINNRDRLPYIIKHGLHKTILVNGIDYTLPMPSDTTLNVDEITKISNFVLIKFAKTDSFFSNTEVAQLLTK